MKIVKAYVNPQNKLLFLLGWGLMATTAGFYLLVTRVAYFQNMPCWFHAATGLYCPGCGATRSFLLLIEGHPIEALAYYPAVPYTVLVYLWFMLSNSIELLSRGRLRMGLRYRNLYLYIAVCLILGNWVVKNILLLCR